VILPELIAQPPPVQPIPTTPQPPTVEGITATKRYHYQLKSSTIDELRNHLNALAITQLGKQLEIHIHLKLSTGNDVIEITGKLRNIHDFKEILNYMTQKGYSLTNQAVINVDSDEDLSGDLEKYIGKQEGGWW